MKPWITASCLAISLLLTSDRTHAEEISTLFNLQGSFGAPTLGGKQFWSDQIFFHGWRIQKHALTGHCRLLNGKDLRFATGSYATCLQTLEKIKAQQRLPAMEGKAVIMLHGLVRTRSSLNKLGKHLANEGDYSVFNVTYASTRAELATHAASLDRIISNLDGITEINFVCHSMGNIVVRHWMADQLREHGKLDSRVKRFVMLAPPNRGSKMARMFGKGRTFKFIVGKPGQELGRTFEEIEKKLATPPPIEFGIIAGTEGRNPWLAGEDDLVVSVEETKLLGARDFRELPLTHTFIMNDAKTLQYALQFFRNGYFQSDALRQPVVAYAVENTVENAVENATP
jgi:hypothetical protein